MGRLTFAGDFLILRIIHQIMKRDGIAKFAGRITGSYGLRHPFQRNSGNLVGYLLALKNGCGEMLQPRAPG